MITGSDFLAAVNGTALQADGSFTTSDASGTRQLNVTILNEKWVTTGGGGFAMTPEAFAVLSVAGCEPYAGGTAVKLGTTIYAVLLNGSGMVDIQQTSP